MKRPAMPVVNMTINGVIVGKDISPYLLDFTWTDNLHGTADEVAATLRDEQGLWRGPWRPELGDVVGASIGYEGNPMMNCGVFQIDIPEAGGQRGNDTLQFKATSAFPDTDQRSQRSKGEEDTSLVKLSKSIAGRHGYGVSGDIDDMDFAYKRQRREYDLSFVRRLGEDYGHFVAIKDRNILFFPRDVLEAAPAIRTIEIGDLTKATDWSAKDQTHNTYKSAKVQYYDRDKMKLIKAEAIDDDAKSGDVLNIDERVENQAQADRLAKGRLAKTNEDKRTASLTMAGDTLLIAGQVVELGATFGRYAGRYLIHKAVHNIKRADWTVKLELKGV
jgi:phage protein D